MTKIEMVNRWRQSAGKNLVVAGEMIVSKHYDWALFFGQLALEKLLKGLILKKSGIPALPIHDLVKLTKLADLVTNKEQQQELIEISRFHIQARYDEIKYELYKQATKEYSSKWMKIIKGYGLWLQKQY